MKAIITGVTGQDGSHMADLLLDKGYSVIGTARRTSGSNSKRIDHLKNNRCFSIVETDISDNHSVRELIKRHPDAVEFYNFAAQSHVATSFNQPSYTFDMTGKSVMNILEAITEIAPEMRLYQASSSEMFGSNYDTRILYQNSYLNVYKGNSHFELPAFQHEVEKFQNEDTKFMPQSPYAIAKLAAHHSVRLYRQSKGIHASCGILFNHEGPRRGDDFVTKKITKWIGEYMRWLEKFKATPSMISSRCASKDCQTIFFSGIQHCFPKLRLGNLDAKRDWGYAPDYMNAAWLMLQQETPDDYVICTGETRSIREFLDEAFSCVGISDWSPLVFIDPKFYRPCEVDYLKGCCKKAKEKLGWKPECSFKDMVKIMVQHETQL